MNATYYPLIFEPRYHDKIWGGTRIFSYKQLPITQERVGESWEISPMAGEVSVIANGPHRGLDLNSYIALNPEAVLGKHVLERYGAEFPLLIKMIDANEHLSVQVHPADEYAQAHHSSKGKTEMWYVLDATEDAVIYVGWKKDVPPEDLMRIIESGEIIDYIHEYKVKPGDTFFIPATTVHAIGKGCLVMEIQEASDITYRLYDYKRKDSKGNERELHVQESATVLNYAATGSEFIPAANRKTDAEGNVLLVECPYFRTSLRDVKAEQQVVLSGRDSFTTYFVAEGECDIVAQGISTPLKKGMSVLLPATVSECVLMPKSSNVKLIECYVP